MRGPYTMWGNRVRRYNDAKDDESAYATSHLRLNVDMAITGESANMSTIEHRCRLGGVQLSSVMSMASPPEQVIRAAAVAADQPEIQLVESYISRRITAPFTSKVPEKMRELVRVFIGACARQFIVFGYAGITFTKHGLPHVISAYDFTPHTREEYNERFLSDLPELPAWRTERLLEVYHAVFTNDILQEKYGQGVTGAPFIVHGPYGQLVKGYPCSPISTMPAVIATLRIANRTGCVALMLNVKSEAFQVGGASAQPALLSQTSLFTGQNKDERGFWSREDDNGNRGTKRAEHILETYKAGLRGRTETIRALRKEGQAESRDKDTDLLHTSVHMADDATNVAFRPAIGLSDPRNAMLRFASDQLLSAFGLASTEVEYSATAMRSAHINTDTAEKRYLMLKSFVECVNRCLNVWRIAAAEFPDDIAPAPDEDIVVAPPIDMTVLLKDRLNREGMVALLESHIPQLNVSMMLPDGEPVAKVGSHAKLETMPKKPV